jgi:hypothetical protein
VDGVGFVTLRRYALPLMDFLSLNASFKRAVKKRHMQRHTWAVSE